MNVPTVTLKHKKTGQRIIVNESDYVDGGLPNGINISSADWDRVNETSIDVTAEAVETSKAQAAAVAATEAKADAVEKKA